MPTSKPEHLVALKAQREGRVVGDPLAALLCLSVPFPGLPWGRRFCSLKTGFWPLAALGFGSPDN